MASNFDFYGKMFSKLNAGLSTYWLDVAANIVGAITPVATTLLLIYTSLWGWSQMRGSISEPITDGVSRIVRLSVITGLALSVGRYNTYLADMLWNTPDALAAVVASGHSDGNSNMQFLDGLMSKLYDMGQAYNDQAQAKSTMGIPDLTLLATALVIWIVAVSVTGYAAFLLALSKMALAILLGIGPLFILLTIFEPTKKFFDSWMGQAINYVFLVVLTAAAIKLIMSIIENYVGAPDVVAALVAPSINQALPAIVFCFIGILVLLQLPAMASALGGGAAMGTLGAVGWAYGKAKSGGKSVTGEITGQNRSERQGNRRNKAANARWAQNNPSAATRAGTAVAGAPMAVYRKVTGGTKNRVAKG